MYVSTELLLNWNIQVFKFLNIKQQMSQRAFSASISIMCWAQYIEWLTLVYVARKNYTPFM